MKKINIIFLSVILALAMTACNGGKDNASNQTEKQTESIKATEEATKATEAVTKTEAEATQEAVSEAESESEVQTTEPEENRMQEQVVEKEEPASQNNNNSSPKEEPEQKNDTDFGNGGGSSDSNEGQSEKEESGNSNEESGFAAYNPQNVVSLATAKCQAGGMITTQQNLDNLLAAGKITQEEYNEYYPYDGMKQTLIQQAPCQGNDYRQKMRLQSISLVCCYWKMIRYSISVMREYTQQEAQTFTSFDVTDSKTE